MAHPAAVKDIAKLRAELKAVNEQLWDIEDDIRLKEKVQAFDQGFIDTARSVYLRNDERARIKKAINRRWARRTWKRSPTRITRSARKPGRLPITPGGRRRSVRTRRYRLPR